MIRKALLPLHLSFAVIGLEAESFAALAQVPPGLTRTEPVRCGSNSGDVVLHRRYIQTTGNGVEVDGNCDVKITGSHIVAGGVGILVAGNGDVHIEDSTVEGAQGGLVVSGNGDLAFRGTTVKGGVAERGNGDLIDLGGNQVSGSVSSTTRGVPRGGGVIVGGSGSIVVDGDGGVSIRSGRDTLTVKGAEGEVTITDGRTGSITARGVPGDVTIQGPGGSIHVDGGGYVRLSSGGSSLTIAGDWRDTSSRYGPSDMKRLMVELNATAEGGEIHVDLAGDVLFDSGSAVMRPDAQAQLAKVAYVLRQKASGEIYVIGHTDAVGSDDSNQKLSEGRAVSVMRWLNERERIPADLLRGQGMGEKKPIAYNTLPDGRDNPAGRAQNRRVEVRFPAKR